MTISSEVLNKRMFLRSLGNQEVEKARECLLTMFAQKDTWKKSEFKRQLSEMLQSKQVDLSEKEINKVVAQYTQIEANNVTLI